MHLPVAVLCLMIHVCARWCVICACSDPCGSFLGVQNAWHHELLKRMVDDMARVTIDPVFPPPHTSPAVRPAGSAYYGAANRANGFKLMHSESPTFVAPVCCFLLDIIGHPP